MSQVVAVHTDPAHGFSKATVGEVELLAGIGVAGDAHAGATVQHRSRVRADPTRPNLRQVHLMRAELLDELVATGFDVAPGDLGENVTTRGVDLLALPTGTLLRLGPTALISVTGLRNPCIQIERFRPGMLAAVRGCPTPADGPPPEDQVLRRAGVMAVVVEGGPVRPGDEITAVLPPEPRTPLRPV